MVVMHGSVVTSLYIINHCKLPRQWWADVINKQDYIDIVTEKLLILSTGDGLRQGPGESDETCCKL